MAPLLFHEVHGERVRLFKDRRVLRRYTSPDYKGGIAFSHRPVKIGEKVRLRLLKDGKGWLGFLTFGFTKHNPDTLNFGTSSFPEDINSSAAKRAGFWTVFVNRQFFEEDDILFFSVNSLGTVHYGVNDENKGTLVISEQCDRKDLWAMVDINVDDMMVQLVDPPLRNGTEGGFQPLYEELQEDEYQNAPCPLYFHSTCGDHTKVSNDGCTARRLPSSSSKGDLIYLGKWSEEILPPLHFIDNYFDAPANGHVETRFAVFSGRTVTVNEKICLHLMNGFGDFTFGFTNYNPDIKNEKSSRSDFKFWGISIERELSVKDQILYYYVMSTGDICFGANNKDLGVYFSVVEIRNPLWAILILPDDAIVQFLDPRLNQIGPPIPKAIPTVMRFHPIHGKKDVVSRDGSKAMMQKYDVTGTSTDSIVYTYRPMRIDELISLRISIIEKLHANSCLLMFGFTNNELAVSAKTIQTDRAKILLRGQNILFHIYVDSLGDVHFWSEGDSERRSMSAVDIRSNFWMFLKTNVPANMYFVETNSERPPCKYVYNLSSKEFYFVHGKNLVRQYSSIQSIKDDALDNNREGLAFSSKPIELNKKICLRILAIPDEASSIQIGVTSLAPALPSRLCQDPANRSKIWTRHLEKELCKNNYNIYFFVNSLGEVLYGVNGEDKGVLTSGVDVVGELWATVEVYGLSTIVMFTNASGLRPISVIKDSIVDQRFNKDWRDREFEEFDIKSIEDDIPMETEECSANDNVLRFHRIHGQNVRVSQNGFEAQLVDEEDFRSGFAFSSRPIGTDEQICLGIKNYEYDECSFIFGFTNIDPANLSEAIRRNVFKPYLVEVRLLLIADLYIRLSPKGDVHFWNDQYYSKSNCFEGIGAKDPVWLLVEVPDTPAVISILEPKAACQPPIGITYNLHPFCFHLVHGRNVSVYSRMTAEVECRAPSVSCRDGVAFTSRTVCVNEKVYLSILTDIEENIDIKLGYTNHNPLSLAGRNNICENLINIDGYWSQSVDKQFYKKKNIICFYVNHSGEVNFEVNGEDRGILVEGVDVNAPLWALLELSGKVTLMFLNAFGRFRFREHTSYSYLINDRIV